ncbi:MAG: hypothetical protein U1G08_00700 [Verrucomicrobiota bacterium]
MSPFLLAAWWEPLIPVAVVVGTLILTSLQAAWKRSRQRTSSETHEEFRQPAAPERWEDTHPSPAIPRWQRRPAATPSLSGTVRTTSLPPSPWERELERMLAPSTSAAPPILSEEPETEVVFPRLLPPLLAGVSTSDPATLETAEVPSLPVPNLVAADARVERAATLQERVRAHLNLVDTSVEQAHPQSTPTMEFPNDRSSRSGIRRLRSISSARRAFVAATVFGPPRSNL